MFTILTLRYVILLGFAGLLIWAVISDFISLLIPNRLSIAVVLLFAAHAAANPAAVDWLGGLLVGAVVFTIATVFFRFRLMGGGDVKLMAAVALWAGPQQLFGFLVVTGLVGGLLAIIATTRLRLIVEFAANAVGGSQAIDGISRGVIPYGIAIAAGGLYVAAGLLAG